MVHYPANQRNKYCLKDPDLVSQLINEVSIDFKFKNSASSSIQNSLQSLRNSVSPKPIKIKDLKIIQQSFKR